MRELIATIGILFSQPWLIAAMIGALCLLGLLLLRIWRLGVVLRKLRALPAGKRRYALERDFHIYPGTGNLPLAFVKRRRKRYRRLAAGWAIAIAVGIIGLTAEQWRAAAAMNWTVGDAGLRAVRYGYEWRIEVRNAGREPLLIDELGLHVIRRGKHRGPLDRRPNFGPAPEFGAVVPVAPGRIRLPLPAGAEQVAVPPGSERVLRYVLAARHQPGEGWIYDVRLHGRWEAPSLIGVREWAGTAYRIGWPGLPRWYEEEGRETPGAKPVGDPPIQVTARPGL